MGYLFTRQQLYELVWADPISTLAKSLGVSDVGLAKACRRGDIPLPPRGYWAKLNAGRQVTRTPLPLRTPGASNRVEVGAGRPQAFRQEAAEAPARDTAPPAPPVYDETLEAVEARIRQALPAKFRYMRSLDNAHPPIARLLREDDARREAMARNPHAWDKPRFESPFEQRRLIFLSNLFTLLATLDVRASVQGREARELGLHIGGQHVDLKVDTLASLRPRKGPPKGKRGEPMAAEVRVARWQHDEREEWLFWSDSDTNRLEDQLREMAVALVLTAERQYRKARQFSYECDRHSFEEKMEQTRKTREEAEQREREARLQAERDRVTRLLGQVSAWQQAQQIRAYVEAVLSSPDALSGRAFEGERDTWAHWARTVADGLDPLASPELACPDRDATLPADRTDACPSTLRPDRPKKP
ncbi:hypothetical protein P5X00_39755 (plasmid) [Paraburkholderia sp. A2RO-4L]|uniref:hypothetical protein n=1 Tax=Paraburkholderia sp. A2RO-4L TaxID=3028374 RepID=UPI003DA82488